MSYVTIYGCKLQKMEQNSGVFQENVEANMFWPWHKCDVDRGTAMNLVKPSHQYGLPTGGRNSLPQSAGGRSLQRWWLDSDDIRYVYFSIHSSRYLCIDLSTCLSKSNRISSHPSIYLCLHNIINLDDSQGHMYHQPILQSLGFGVSKHLYDDTDDTDDTSSWKCSYYFLFLDKSNQPLHILRHCDFPCYVPQCGTCLTGT